MARPPFLALAIFGALLAACASDPPLSGPQLKAVFDKGLKAYDAGNYEEAYKIWISIDDVDLAALRNVAIMLRTGKGVQKDPKAAEAMMARAAEAGLFTAQADLGDMLLKGETGPPDPKAAEPWLKLAALAGHPMAEYELGEIYEQGLTGEKNLEVARKLYEAAAASGVSEAAERLKALPPSPESPAPPELRLNPEQK
jgi:TPR repeat protein